MQYLRTILNSLLSVPFLIAFSSLLVIFHPIQVITNKLWGYPVRKKSVDLLNYLLLKTLLLLGNRYTIYGMEKIPQDRPLIIISNHQSELDIPPVVWAFRKRHPKFISKIELGKNIPSISYNLVHGKSALIDRNNKKQAISEIIRVGRHIEAENYSVCIFPEGTRSKNGKLKRFNSAGIHTLVKCSPNALLVPFVIDGNYKILPKNGLFPLNTGIHLSYTILDPIDPSGKNIDELVDQIESHIRNQLEN